MARVGFPEACPIRARISIDCGLFAASKLQVLTARDYTNAVLRAAENGIVGGAIYDLL
jgi:hypothetical protein